MATLSFKNINKIYDNKVQAVYDFNLDIKDKEFIVFVGPSGCGKSTTLRMVAGLEEITSGELFIDGHIVNLTEPKDRNVAMVFQSYALYPHMTVFENMAFSLEMGRKAEEAKDENGNQIYIVDKEKIKDLKYEIKKLKTTFALADDIKELNDKIIDLETHPSIEKKKKNDVYYVVDKKQVKYLEKEIKKAINNYKKDPEHNPCEAEIIKREKEIEHLLENPSVPKLKYSKYTKEEIKQRVEEAAKILDLTEYLNRKPKALSGGQRQRVALGRAIVRQPKVFLMDEPLSNLDAKLRVQMRNEISRIHKVVGATTIYVTHDQTEAMTMADRIVIMNKGYIQQIGKPDELFNDPVNMFVAGFIGSPSMNFINAICTKGKLVFGDNSIKLSNNQIKLLDKYNGKEIVLGVRPEDIYLKDDINNSNSTQVFKVHISNKELLGRDSLFYGEIDKNLIIIQTKTANNVDVDSVQQFSFNFDKMYFFDKDTKLRIK